MAMKVLFIGGTGNISTAVSKLALEQGFELYHLNRGKSENEELTQVKHLNADIRNFGESEKVLKNHNWDIVVNWIAFTPEHIELDFKLFKGKTKQYVFISSASAYQKPLLHATVTESTPLKNPFWQYSRDKIACEDLLLKYYRENDFPITIVRPSHTYRTFIPSCFDADKSFTLANRMLNGKPIVVPGTGLSRWTLTYASDFALGFCGLMGHSDAIGHAFHITSDEKLTWNQIYIEAGKALGVTPELVHMPTELIYKWTNEYSGIKTDTDNIRGGFDGDKLTNVDFDNSKIKSFVPSFKATTLFGAGIKQVIEWFNHDETRKLVNQHSEPYMDYLLKKWNELI